MSVFTLACNFFIGAQKVHQYIQSWRDKRTFGSFYFFWFDFTQPNVKAKIHINK
jgi:hypothetical protein